MNTSENDCILLTKGEGVFQLLGLEAEQVRMVDGGWWVPPTWHHPIPLGGGWRDGGRMKVDVGDDGCDEFLRKEATKAKAGICDKM